MLRMCKVVIFRSSITTLRKPMKVSVIVMFWPRNGASKALWHTIWCLSRPSGGQWLNRAKIEYHLVPLVNVCQCEQDTLPLAQSCRQIEYYFASEWKQNAANTWAAPPSGHGGLMCSFLVNFCANLFNHRASSVSGSISTRELARSDRQLRLSALI